jgi:hypothetical protein
MAYHIGSSGLVYGLVMFIFWGGILRRNPRTLAISIIIFFLYGGMIYGMFPVDEAVSWESHVMGSVAGIFLAFYFRKAPIYLGDKEPVKEVLTESDDLADTTSNVSHTAENDASIHYYYRNKS